MQEKTRGSAVAAIAERWGVRAHTPSIGSLAEVGSIDALAAGLRGGAISARVLLACALECADASGTSLPASDFDDVWVAAELADHRLQSGRPVSRLEGIPILVSVDSAKSGGGRRAPSQLEERLSALGAVVLVSTADDDIGSPRSNTSGTDLSLAVLARSGAPATWLLRAASGAASSQPFSVSAHSWADCSLLARAMIAGTHGEGEGWEEPRDTVVGVVPPPGEPLRPHQATTVRAVVDALTRYGARSTVLPHRMAHAEMNAEGVDCVVFLGPIALDRSGTIPPCDRVSIEASAGKTAMHIVGRAHELATVLSIADVAVRSNAIVIKC